MKASNYPNSDRLWWCCFTLLSRPRVRQGNNPTTTEVQRVQQFRKTEQPYLILWQMEVCLVQCDSGQYRYFLLSIQHLIRGQVTREAAERP